MKSFLKYFKAKMIMIPLTLSLFTNFNNINKNKMFMVDDTKKIKLPDITTLNEGEMKEIKYGTKSHESFLLIKYNQNLIALSNYCPYQGTPMHTGLLVDNILKCPMDGSSFDITTGKYDIAPSIKDLNKFEIQFDGDTNTNYAIINTNITGKKPAMSKYDHKNKTKFAIIGGGPAGFSCAQTLRQAGYTGEINMYSDDPFKPYDRTSLSKNIKSEIEKIYLNPMDKPTEDFYKEYSINIINNTKIIAIDNVDKIMKLSNGDIKNYDKLLISTGVSAKLPDLNGVDLNGVFTLRTYSDIIKIKQTSLNCKKITIIGTSFIGMELASSLHKSNPELNITMIDRTQVPFQKSFGKEIGRFFQNSFEKKGIKFILNNELVWLQPKAKQNFNVGSIGILHIRSETDKSIKEETILTDMVLIDDGVITNSDLYDGIITTTKDKSAKCDAFLNTSDPDIFSAGDACSYPSIYTGERINFQYYVSAQQQGAIAALNMLGKNVLYDYIPFYWTTFFDKNLQFVGTTEDHDEVFIDGDLNCEFDKVAFNAYFFKGNTVIGFAAFNSPNSANVIYEAFKNNILITPKSLKKGEMDINKIRNILNRVKPKCSKLECLNSINKI